MKIATWNIERPTKTGKKTAGIIKVLQQLNADIIVLTETNDFIDLGAEYTVWHTAALQEKMYKTGERRVSIFSRFPLADKIKAFETFNADTALCVNIATPLGELAVYVTIIGILGNRDKDFKEDLKKQLSDFEKIHPIAKNFCILGDFNISFSDNYYFTQHGRDTLNESFKKHQMKNYTADLHHNIDHIVLTENFVGDRKFILTEWNDPENKATRLSDHKGVMIEIL